MIQWDLKKKFHPQTSSSWANSNQKAETVTGENQILVHVRGEFK